MKALLAFIALSACVFTAKCGELPVPASTIGELFTNVYSATLTNSTAFTNMQPTLFSVNHTFQFFYTATGTNTSTIAIDKTIDGANWIVVGTNTLVATTNFEVTATGKWWA